MRFSFSLSLECLCFAENFDLPNLERFSPGFVFVFDFFLGSKDQKKKSSIFNCYGKVRGLILMSIAKILSVFFLVVLKINKIKTKFFVKMKWNQDPVVIMRNLKLVLRLLNQINAFGGTTVDYISRDVWILNFSLFDGKKRNNDDCENYKFLEFVQQKWTVLYRNDWKDTKREI